jgi:hypothetical protein
MSHFGPFYSFFHREDFDSALPVLTVSHGEKRFTGQGRLVCRMDGSIELWALTDGKAESHFVTHEIGAMIPPDHYMQLRARDRSGREISIERLTPKTDIVLGQPIVRCWQKEDLLSDIQWTTIQTASATSAVHHAQVLLAQTERKSTNTWLAREQQLRISSVVGEIVLKGIEDGRILLTIRGEGDLDMSRAIDSVYHAANFVFGRGLNEVVSSIQENDKVIEQISIRSTKVFEFPFSPFGPQFGQRMVDEPAVVELFEKAVNFFYQSPRDTSRNHLFAIWSNLESSFSVSVLVACTVLEGLCHDMPKDIGKIDSISEAQIDAIGDFITTDMFRAIGTLPLEEKAANDLRNRVCGAFNTPSTSTLLKSWCQSGKYGLQQETFTGWNTVRNRLAHGRLDLFNEVAKRAGNVKVRNALYQGIITLLLQQMGYSGPSFNWITSNWKELRTTA